jgi:hypothetical protein
MLHAFPMNCVSFERGLYCMLGSFDYLTFRLVGGWLECNYDVLLFPLKRTFMKSSCKG